MVQNRRVPDFDFAYIDVSSHVVGKINGKHHVSMSEVEEACESLREARRVDLEDGRYKMLAKGTTEAGRELLLVLYPTESLGEWRLASARRLV